MNTEIKEYTGDVSPEQQVKYVDANFLRSVSTKAVEERYAQEIKDILSQCELAASNAKWELEVKLEATLLETIKQVLENQYNLYVYVPKSFEADPDTGLVHLSCIIQWWSR